MRFKQIIIVCGHYGSGKTTFALSFAKKLAKSDTVTLVDLDIVNPYFRSSDHTADLETFGVRVIAPAFAGTTLDTPALSPKIQGAIDMARENGYLIIDAGGDDAGCVALGCYAQRIKEIGYDMLYVVNERREAVAEVEGAVEILREIETASKLKATGIVGNTHLCSRTTPEVIEKGAKLAQEVANAVSLPLIYNCYPDFLCEMENRLNNPLAVEVSVLCPWGNDN